MLVGDNVTLSRVTRDGLIVSGGNFGLVHRVDDILTVLLLVQVVPDVRPVVSGVQFHRFAQRGSVGVKLYEYLDGSQAVLVVRVVPYLPDRYVYRRDIGVFNNIGIPVLRVRIGYGVDLEIAVPVFDHVDRDRDRTVFLSPSVAGVPFGDGIVIGAGVFVKDLPKDRRSVAVEGYRIRRGHRGDDRIAFHVIAGVVRSGGKVEGEMHVFFGHRRGAHNFLFRLDIRLDAGRLHVDLVGMDRDVNVDVRVGLFRQRIREVVNVARHLVHSRRVEGGRIGGGSGVEHLGVNGERDVKALAASDHVAVIGVEIFVEGYGKAISVLDD